MFQIHLNLSVKHCKTVKIDIYYKYKLLWRLKMNLSSFDYFVMLAYERSFTRAAQKLHITQQSLSSHIAALEEELGCQLIVRHVPLELTYAGNVFLRHSGHIQQELTQLRREFCDIVEKQTGILRIGVAATRGRTLMPTLVPEFQQHYPNIEIELVEGINDTLQYSLLKGEIDLAIANFPKNIPDIELCDFYGEDIALLVSQKLVESLAQQNVHIDGDAIARGDLSSLSHCPFVLTNQDNIAGRIGSILFAKSNVSPIVRVRSDNMETLLSLCLHGAGACFCPLNLMEAVLTPGEISTLLCFPLGDQAHYQIRFGYLKTNYQWKVITEFIHISLNSAFKVARKML